MDPVRIVGMRRTLRALDDRPEWVAGPLRRFFERWGSFAERRAKTRLKHGDRMGWTMTATTRRSITHETDPSPMPEYARFGSNQMTARWGDFGTGLLSEDPDSSRRRHWPPASALESWARKRGIEGGGYVVARAIGMRGGIEPRRFIRDSAEEAKRQVPRFVATLATEIENEARGGGDGAL